MRAVVLGRAAPAVAVFLSVGVQEGQAVLSESLTSLQAKHLHCVFLQPTQPRQKCLHYAEAVLETGDTTEMILESWLKK